MIIIIIIIIIIMITYQGTEKTVEHESGVYTNYNWCSWYSHQRINKWAGGLGNKRKSGDHPNYCITEIDQNTEKRPGDEETCCHSDSSERTSANTDVKNCQELTLTEIIYIYIYISFCVCVCMCMMYLLNCILFIFYFLFFIFLKWNEKVFNILFL